MWLSQDAKRLQNLLLMKARELGRVPTFTEVELDDRLPKANDYAYHFGSFSKACDSIRSKINTGPTSDNTETANKTD
jgi:hypothetical protein